MALNVYSAQVTLPVEDGLPEDSIVNTFHFLGTGAGQTQATDANDIVFRLQNFYQAIDGPVFPAGIASPGVIKVYKLTDLPPRIPIATDTVVISDGAGTTLPTEVACCISYASAAVSGIPAARRRGRVYIGPLASASLTVVSGKTVITSTVRAALASAADGLRVNSNLDQVPWCVYSPTTATFPGDLAAAHTVTHGYVDDAFDTVRSRGSDATTRTLWP